MYANFKRLIGESTCFSGLHTVLGRMAWEWLAHLSLGKALNSLALRFLIYKTAANTYLLYKKNVIYTNKDVEPSNVNYNIIHLHSLKKTELKTS